MRSVSLVIPVYNEEGSVEELLRRILETSRDEGYDLETIFVNDGSTDNTPSILDRLAEEDGRVKVLHFRHNRGKADALNRGFRLASGDFVITMDGDLQDDPREIPALLAKIDEGWDVVSGWKKIRHDPVDKTLPSKVWNRMIRWLTGIEIHDMNCGLKAYRREVVKSVSLYGELHRYIPVLAKMEGYRSTEIPVTHHPRTTGRSKYGFGRIFKGIFDLMTVLFLGRFTSRPMHFFGMLGLLSGFIGVLLEIYLIVLKYGFNEPFRSHLAMLMLGVLLIILGVQLFSMGLIGEMLVYQDRKRIKTDL